MANSQLRTTKINCLINFNSTFIPHCTLFIMKILFDSFRHCCGFVEYTKLQEKIKYQA